MCELGKTDLELFGNNNNIIMVKQNMKNSVYVKFTAIIVAVSYMKKTRIRMTLYGFFFRS